MVSDYDIKPLNWVISNEAVIGGQSAFAVPITVPSALHYDRFIIHTVTQNPEKGRNSHRITTYPNHPLKDELKDEVVITNRTRD
eukprot:scaffold44654_cov599-Skeletonema_marinoi.AAC.1